MLSSSPSSTLDPSVSFSAPAVPEPFTPPRCAVPDFPPIRAGGRGVGAVLSAVIRRRRVVVPVLMATAAALAVSAAHSGPPPRVAAATPRAPSVAVALHKPPAPSLVRAPVRIADAAVVALLRPGTRVDVMAGARVVAADVKVVDVPVSRSGREPSDSGAALVEVAGGPGGALVVLAVPRRTAAALSGAAATSPLGVVLC